MSLSATTHINFRGEARAALEFYQSVFGGEIAIFTYEEGHSVADPIEAEQVMWGQVAAENGVKIMAYDVQVAKPFERGVNSFYVSLRGDDPDEISGAWDKLADGAVEVLTPLGPPP